MTEKLYYQNSFLYDFVAALMEWRALPDGRTAVILDRTAFYPTSGGQTFDTGWLELERLEGERAQFLPKLHVVEVEENDFGEVLHIVEGKDELSEAPTRVRGFIDVERRRDHMQQHSGQHVLSAAFVELFDMPTVSFHMGDTSCTIDLDAKSLTPAQLKQAEFRANQIVWEDREVSMCLATEEEGRARGVRKIPEAGHEKLRLIEVKGFDLCACGGTHVRSTGQIGAIQLRKTEKVKQGVRVEFVCGARGLEHARKDYETLVESAAAFSAHVWDVPAQIRKVLEEAKAAAKTSHRQLEEIAELTARQWIMERTAKGEALVFAEVLAERDLAYTKLLAQKLTAAVPNVIALLAAGAGQSALVFAQSANGPHDMGALMKDIMARLGSRGGGSRDLAQGGVPDSSKMTEAIAAAHAAILAKA
ncbi:MAG TPA: DHHA1 domain-containing protein [candidate division Zixibacteria bacterium]|nr:DHHA1 domain-containing protein [candidate division Zixibacteria bacterium]